MAGISWIKLEVTLPNKPVVQHVKRACQCSINEAVGLVVRVLCWADGITEDGVCEGYTPADVDETFGASGLAAGLLNAGWVTQTSDGWLAFLDWDRHNGENAKKRALNARAAVKSRANKKDQMTNVTKNYDENVTNVIKKRELDKIRDSKTEVLLSNAHTGARGECVNFSKEEKDFLAAYGKQPRNAEGFREAFDEAVGLYPLNALTACAALYVEELRERDGSTRYQQTPERWLADKGYADYLCKASRRTIPANSIKYKRPFYGKH